MRIATVLVSGVAVAAVAGIAIAGTAVARNHHPSANTPAAGSPGTPTASPTPSASPPAPPADTPAAGSRGTPALSPTPPADSPTPATVGPSATPTRKPLPLKQPAVDPVAACKQWLKDVDVPKPGPTARPVAELTSVPGTILILADSKYWAGCDSAYARHNGVGSIRRPEPLTGPAPGDAAAFTLANNLIPINGKQYEYYWAAGRLPADVTRITYAFPDGRTTNAVIQGKYWLMQHQTTTPWKAGSPTPTTQIKVTLYGADGQPLRDFLMNWGEDTCAQLNHGC